VVVTSLFLPSFEGGCVGETTRQTSALFLGVLASFLLVIRVHSFVGEVGSGVLRAGEFSNLGLREAVVARGSGGCAIYCLVLASSEILEEDFFLGGFVMRRRIQFPSAMDEMVLKQNTDLGQRAILHWEVTAIELAWINDTPPTWRASYRCLEPDHTPGVASRGAFG
jgi:hypothetical protein